MYEGLNSTNRMHISDPTLRDIMKYDVHFRSCCRKFVDTQMRYKQNSLRALV